MQNVFSGAICPVSLEKVNDSAVRLGAFLTICLSILGLYTENSLLFACLGLDFALRAFSLGRFSPIALISKYLVPILNLPTQMVDTAPKKFAAGVGVVFCALISGFLLIQWFQTAHFLGIILLVCASLEAFLGYCVGCQVYAWFVLPFSKKIKT